MPAKVLLGLVVFDSIASYVLWKYYGMIENNPIMLWALTIGWVYWVFKVIQIGLVGVLWLGYDKNRIARFAVWLLIVVFTFVWVQYFVGELV